MKQMGWEKSTAEVRRSRKKREGLSKRGLLRHGCPYTSLEVRGERSVGNPGLWQLDFSALRYVGLQQRWHWLRP